MDAVEEVKTRLSIEDVVSEYVQLKRAGRNYKGLSPFTNERSPSFVVSPEKQIWHDFSSGRGGDMFSFVMEMEGLEFKEALEVLARRAGVDLEQFRTSPEKRGDNKQKERLYELNELATKFYQVQFTKSKLTLEYVLKKRGYTKETALSWRLGYSPNTGKALVEFAKSKGFTDREIKQAGLTNQYGGDLFRGRLMIPLQDDQGKVVGFTARQLVDEPNAPKYINTPQTPLYDKSRHVFGLHLAKAAIRKAKYVVLAEGNLDVIASHQAGVAQCVATAGTALTEFQLKALKRLTGDVRLAFDADRAGIAATERAIPIASKVGVTLSVVTIEGGKDPDELIKQDVSAWQKVIDTPQYALDWLIGYYQKALDLNTAVGKREFRDTIIPVVKLLSNRGDKEHYIKRVADITDVSDVVLREMQLDSGENIAREVRKKPKVTVQLDKKTIEILRIQNRLLSLLLMQPRLRDMLETLQSKYLPDENARYVLEFLLQNPDFDGNPAQTSGLKKVGDYVKMLVLHYEELYQDLELLELRYEAERLQSHLVSQYVQTEKQQIREKLQAASGEEELTLLRRDKELNELLGQFKRGK
jgi:DNA primase